MINWDVFSKFDWNILLAEFCFLRACAKVYNVNSQFTLYQSWVKKYPDSRQ